MTKYLDQSISSNEYHNPEHWEGGVIPLDVLVHNFLTSYKYGLKTMYYSNVFDNKGEDESGGCESGACHV
jgi:ribonucleoside-diphosphate reductase alpha chain